MLPPLDRSAGWLVSCLLIQTGIALWEGAIASSSSALRSSIRLPSGPKLLTQHSRNVTARLNGTAILNCRVRHIGARQVSWGRGIEVLTVGLSRFTDDRRFEPLHQEYSEDWSLRIRSVRASDAGGYFCQLGTSTPILHQVHLMVVEPQVEIEGAPELYINRGSNAILTCVIRAAHKPPENVRWTHDSKLVQYDTSRAGVQINTRRQGNNTVSEFLIEHALPSDSGEYFCDPDGLQQVKVTVHILNGDYPAAMQTGGQDTRQVSSALHVLCCSCLLLLLRLASRC